MSDVLNIFIGYDQREDEAWNICRLSMARRSSQPLHVVKLDERALRYNSWYDRPWKVDHGQKFDARDGKPFSTDFAFTRFLVPALSLYEGWAVFCDCDFLFTADIAGLFGRADERYAVQVVKHNHDPFETKKMEGQLQTRYFRKNWSSMVLWNCAHPSNRFLTTNAVNHEPGQWLHAFSWLRDDEIGELPRGWNHLSGVDPHVVGEVPPAIHFTKGLPNMPGREGDPFADLWFAEQASRRAFGNPLPREIERGLS